MKWSCEDCGPHPGSHSAWCAAGCGRDFRRMVMVKNDAYEHIHGRTVHTHAFASLPHSHFMRAVCGFRECIGYPTHNIHPAPDMIDEDRRRA